MARPPMENVPALFSAALGLTPPWQVVEVGFSASAKRLDVYIDFPRGSTFPCPRCGAEGAKAYDTTQRSWRHLNFFQHECHLHAWVPRVRCPKCRAIAQVRIPWARPESGFTLLFEALVMALAKEMPVRAIAKLLGEHDTRLWRILRHYVEEARARQDLSRVRRIGLDETASRRGHRYVTLMVDLDRRRLLFATPGRDQAAVAACAADLQARGGDPKAVTNVTCDMSAPYIEGIRRSFPDAEITFDRFHVMQLASQAVDAVRREETRDHPQLLKKTRYLWLKSPSLLTARQREQLLTLMSYRYLKTARAYRLRLALQEFFELPDRSTAEAFLRRWYFWATHSRLEPMKRLARTLKEHWEGVLSWFSSHLTNAVLEGISSLVQAAKARARGYRTTENLITMAYILAGGLEYQLPT